MPLPHIASVAPAAPNDGNGSRLARLAAALWFGGGAFILLTAAAIFRAAETPTVAANVVGAILTRWHYVALLAPLALVFLLRNRARTFVLAMLFAAIVFASTQTFVDLRIRQIRAASPLAISALDRDDPVRRQFGILHGVSSLLLLLQVMIAAVAVSETT